MAKSGSRFGDWLLVEKLGEGGNGVVWRCSDQTGQVGALKLLKSYLLEKTGDTAQQGLRNRRTMRFLDEISFLRSYAGKPGIIPLLDSYLPEIPTKLDPPYFVMPLATSLPAEIAFSDPSLERLVEIFRDLSSALVFLHSKGISHRDIKPENILLLNATPCFSDFGLVDFEGISGQTGSSEILGPLFFVAPEMMTGDTVDDPRPADVYSFAKAFWVAVTRQRFPIPGELRVTTEALRLSTYVMNTRATSLDFIIDRCTRHSPSERPAAGEVFEELVSWCRTPELEDVRLETMAKLARVLSAPLTAIADSKSHREWLKRCGQKLLDAAELQLKPLHAKLCSFALESYLGLKFESRLSRDDYDGYGGAAWDMWLAENAKDLIGEAQQPSAANAANHRVFLWMGRVSVFSTLTHADLSGGHSHFICGLHVLIKTDGTVRLCAANAIAPIGPSNSDRIIVYHSN